MHNDHKARIRITVERISITTMRVRSGKFYCETCRRALSAEEIHGATGLGTDIEAVAIATATDTEKGELK